MAIEEKQSGIRHHKRYPQQELLPSSQSLCFKRKSSKQQDPETLVETNQNGLKRNNKKRIST